MISERLSKDFSPDQERTQRALRALYTTLNQQAGSPALRAAYERWAGLVSMATDFAQQKAKPARSLALRKAFQALGFATKEPDFGHFVFATHTFFALLAKLLAVAALGLGSRRAELSLKKWASLADHDLARRFSALETGAMFSTAGPANFLEGDCFGWYACECSPELLDSLRAIVARLAEYEFDFFEPSAEQSPDCLKRLYFELVPAELRKALGEFYTPDWLAARLLDLLDQAPFQGDRDARLLDPACGSGTFLLLAIHAVRRNPRSGSMAPGELLRTICRNIVGIDLNPVAVIAARVNYLFALGPLWRHRGEAPLEIPVHLGDSIRLPSQANVRDGDAREATPSLSRRTGEGRGEGNPAASPTSLPRQEGASSPLALSSLGGRRGRKALAPARDAPQVRSLSRGLGGMAGGLDGFDYVVGNPPWIGWEDLPDEYRRATSDLWRQHGLFVHRGMDAILGKGRKDLSMLLTYVAAEHYLKPGGKLGFVITQAVFKMAGAGQGFRRFLTTSQVPLRCERVEDYSELQLFAGARTKTALFVLKKGAPHTYPVPYSFYRSNASGQKPVWHDGLASEQAARSLQCEEWQAEPSDSRDPTSAWLTGSAAVAQAVRKVLGPSDYRAHQGLNTGGANAVYWFEILTEEAGGIVIARSLGDAAKRKLPCQSVPLEMERLFPLLRGGDVTPWCGTTNAWVLLTQDLKTRRGLGEAEMARTPNIRRWLDQHRAMLEGRAAYKRFFNPGTTPFWSMFDAGPYTLKPWKVVWPRIARRLQAAVISSLEGKPVLAQETVSCIGLEDAVEAFYVAGVINSTPFRFAVSSFSQPGSKSFGTPGILERARIPRFDPVSPLHHQISAEACRLSNRAPDARESMHAVLDGLCRSLWRLEPEELRAIRRAYSETYANS